MIRCVSSFKGWWSKIRDFCYIVIWACSSTNPRRSWNVDSEYDEKQNWWSKPENFARCCNLNELEHCLTGSRVWISSTSHWHVEEVSPCDKRWQTRQWFSRWSVWGVEWVGSHLELSTRPSGSSHTARWDEPRRINSTRAKVLFPEYCQVSIALKLHCGVSLTGEAVLDHRIDDKLDVVTLLSSRAKSLLGLQPNTFHSSLGWLFQVSPGKKKMIKNEIKINFTGLGFHFLNQEEDKN